MVHASDDLGVFGSPIARVLLSEGTESKTVIKVSEISSLEPKSFISGGEGKDRVTLHQQPAFPFLGSDWLAADPELNTAVVGEPQDGVKAA